MALVDVLDFIPQQNTAQRTAVLEILNRLVPALAKVQDPTTENDRSNGKDILKNRGISSLVILLFLFHPNIV